MIIKNLTLKNFRNFDKLSLDFPDNGINIYGFNGVGKTNLLEAIFYFSTGKPFKSKTDLTSINFQRDFFRITANIIINKTKYFFEIGYNRQKKKIVKINGQLIDKLTDLYGKFKVIFFSPSDIDIISGSPINRRLFFDKAIAQVYPEYLIILNKQRKIIKQRNFLLKSDFLKNEKLSWDKQLILNSKKLYDYRINYLKTFNNIFLDKYSKISNSLEVSEIKYKLNFKLKDSYEDSFRQELLKISEQEILFKRTLIGPHLDDYEIYLNSKNSRIFGSQGQLRSIAIALKLSQTEVLTNMKIYPVLIFDDVIGELDAKRTSNLLNLLSAKHQIFIASPKLESLPKNRKNIELKIS